MRRSITIALKSLLAAMIIIATVMTVPASAQAASSDAASRSAAVAAVQTAMMAQLPEGTPYDNSVKYVSSCKINGQSYVYTGYGCVSFALQFEETTFGKGGSYTKTTNCAVSNIESGDIVRVPSTTGGHTFVVISIDESGATIAEANYNSSVHYGRHISNEELAANLYVLHRV